MTITVFYAAVTVGLGLLVAFMGGGFAYGCRLEELDAEPEE